MKISIVVVFGHGRDAAPLECALASLRTQSRPPDELVLVLNGAELPAWAAVYPDLQVVRLGEDIGCPAGRNAGAKGATGDVLVFVDDDGQLEQYALAAIERAFEKWPRKTAFAGCVVDPKAGTARKPGADGVETMHFSGGVFAVDRLTFLAHGGYCEYSLRQGEELDLALKLFKHGVRFRRLRDFVLLHPIRARGWASDEVLLGTTNSVRVFWTRLPIPAAAAGTVWKVTGHAVRLVRERRMDLLSDLLCGTARAANAGARERDPLRWREYRAAWRLIHPGPLSVLLGSRTR